MRYSTSVVYSEENKTMVIYSVAPRSESGSMSILGLAYIQVYPTTTITKTSRTSHLTSHMDQEAILKACEDGDLSRLQTLLEDTGLALSELSPVNLNSLLYRLPMSIAQMLEKAARGAHTDIIRYLKPLYPDVISKDTAVVAIISGSIELFSQLVAHDPTLIRRGYSILGNCISCAMHLPNAFEFIKTLLDLGADPNFSRGLPIHYPVCVAARYGKIEVLKLLICHQATLKGTPALFFAAFAGDFEIAKLLLEEGMGPNTNTTILSDYPSVLCAAVKGNSLEVIGLLLEHGADPTIPDSYGATPMALAMSLNNTAAAALLGEYHDKHLV